MNPPHRESDLPRHHLIHLHLDPHHHHHHHHHHHIHIHLCHHHPAAPTPPTHHHHHHHAHAHPAPVFIPGAYLGAASWQPEPPRSAVEEPAENQDADRALHAEDDDEDPMFVLTDEWAEFFAKSDAKRRLAKQQKNRGRK